MARLARDVRAQLVIRVFWCLLALAVDYLLAPALSSWKPALTLLFFTGLMLVRQGSSQPSAPALKPLSPGPLLLFWSAHVLLLVVASHFGLAAAPHSYASPSLLASAVKVLVLPPALLLYPASRRFWGMASAEATAAVVGLLTFIPDRLFELVWPTESRVLAAAIAALCRPFVPATHVASNAEGAVVAGPSVDMILGISCSGIRSIVLFQFLFAMILLIRWNSLNKLRAFTFYVGASLLLVLANGLRLTVVYLTANLTSSALNLGWPLFVATFLLLSWFTRVWITSSTHHGSPAHTLDIPKESQTA